MIRRRRRCRCSEYTIIEQIRSRFRGVGKEKYIVGKIKGKSKNVLSVKVGFIQMLNLLLLSSIFVMRS